MLYCNNPIIAIITFVLAIRSRLCDEFIFSPLPTIATKLVVKSISTMPIPRSSLSINNIKN